MMLSKIKNYCLCLLLFLLPWQTRLIFFNTSLGGYDWEYGRLSLYATEILLGFIILLALIEKFKNKYFTSRLSVLSRTRLLSVIFGLLLFFLVYLRLVSLSRETTWQYLNWVIYGFCLGVIIIESQWNFKKLSLALWSGSLLPAILAIHQFFTQSVLANKWLGIASQHPGQLGVAVLDFGYERWLRAYGSFGWPNALGIYLSVIFILGIILIYKERTTKIQAWLLIGQIVILFGLFFSFARGAWFALIAGCLILFFKHYRDKKFWPQFIFYILMAVILLSIFKPLVFSRVNLDNRLEMRSISQRLEQWQDFKIVFSQNKFFGVGPGAYTYGLFYYQLDHGHSFEPIHNIFLLFLGEWGIVGIGIFFSLIFFIRKKINWSFAPFWVLLLAGLFDHWSLSMFSGLMVLAVFFSLGIKYLAIDTQADPE
jgi:O-antigen ligase